MSTPQLSPLGFKHLENGNTTKICGRFQIVAGPVMGPFVGAGFTPTRTGVGDYLITFGNAFSYLLSGSAICQVAGAATDLVAQLGAFTPGGTGAATLQIRTKAIGVNTEVTNNDWVHFEATLYGECLEP